MTSQPAFQTLRNTLGSAASRALLLALLAACTAYKHAAAGETGPVSSRGAEIVSAFKSELQSALSAGLQQGLPEAIAACRVQAPAIAESLSQQGVSVGRTSHRLRNPTNTPPAWVAPILADYLYRPEDREPRQVNLDAAHVGYVEPIMMQPVCTTCHGEALAPAVTDTLAELYPEDRATGFAIGDLRGVFWVELPTEEAR